jgi:hypothetical protein
MLSGYLTKGPSELVHDLRDLVCPLLRERDGPVNAVGAASDVIDHHPPVPQWRVVAHRRTT